MPDATASPNIGSITITRIVPEIMVTTANLKINIVSILKASTQLNNIIDQRIYFYYPTVALTLPCATYYELNKDANLYSDDAELGLKNEFRIDVWSKSSTETIGSIVKRLLLENGYICNSYKDGYNEVMKAYKKEMIFTIESTA